MKNISMKQLKKLYTQNAENNTPDMDSIWEKIESGLEPKPESGVTSKPVQKKNNFRNITVWGTVCAAALLIIPVSVRLINNNSVSNSLSSNKAAYEQAQDNAGFQNIYGNSGGAISGDAAYNDENSDADNISAEATENSPDADSETKRRVVFYEELFPYSDESPVPSAETSGDDFFVEEKILIETDMIVNAYVDRVYSKGNTVCYEITAENAETFETESFILESATPYVLKQDRSYILPLKAENGEYSLVFENAPQIEVSENVGMVFHNGWKTLDALEDDPIEVIYPQNGIDDFFYDRMRFTYSSDISPLIDEWHRVKQTE